MIKRALIIADDFTGANDTGVHLKKNNFDIDVVLSTHNLVVNNSLVIDTETRNISGEDAYEKVESMLSELITTNQFDLIYKKIDSTLRGNVAEEIKATIKLQKPKKVVLAPAYPKIGRITKDSVQYLKDIPLKDTEIANDPLKPIWTDNIQEIIEKEFNEKITCYSVDDLKNTYKLSDSYFHIFDATETEHLDKIKAITTNETGVLFVGSAGLAESLFEDNSKPTLSVIGSISDISFRQMEYAKNNNFNVIDIKINDLITNDTDKYVYLIKQSIENGQDTVITATRNKNDYLGTIESFKKLGFLDKAEISNKVKETITTIIRNVLKQTAVSGLFLTGGETAIGIIDVLNSKGCKIDSEILPGVVKSHLIGGPFDGLPIITKAGAFGDKETIVKSVKYLKGVK